VPLQSELSIRSNVRRLGTVEIGNGSQPFFLVKRFAHVRLQHDRTCANPHEIINC